MAKTKPAAQKSTVFTWKRGLKPALLVLGIAALLLQAGYDVYVFRWSAPGHNGTNTNIGTLIIQAIENLNKPAVIEPVSKKVYLPDASLVLPPYTTDTAGGILYSYVPSFDGSDAYANITLAAAQKQGIAKIEVAEQTGGRLWSYKSDNIFSQVPNAQACTRGLTVDFGGKEKYAKLEFSKTLADGRTMYVWSEAHPCQFSLAPLVTYLRQAQSY